MKLQTSPKEFRVWDDLKKEWDKSACLFLDAFGNVKEFTHEGNMICRPELHAIFYTGLKDKEGKKIFEGDIIKDTTGVYLVSYDITRGQFTPRWSLDGADSYVKVIGNIFENPELLEGK